MKYSKNFEENDSFWESPEAVAEYSVEPALMHGEKTIFQSQTFGSLNNKRVLDIGCGGGRTTYFLHQAGANVIGIDISPGLVDFASKRFPDIEFRLGDATTLDFDDNTFDVVLFSFNSLDCIYPKELRIKALNEINRVLRPEGNFIFSHHNLAAFFLGWHKFLRPWKLLFRAKHIFNGNVMKDEIFLKDPAVGDTKIYYAWPKKVIRDLENNQFTLKYIVPNSPLLGPIQKILKTTIVTRMVDPWPYYIFSKRSM